MRILFADYVQNDGVCAVDLEFDCQLASDYLSYGLMHSVRDQIFEHVMAHV